MRRADGLSRPSALLMRREPFVEDLITHDLHLAPVADHTIVLGGHPLDNGCAYAGGAPGSVSRISAPPVGWFSAVTTPP
ncbi:MAG: hypothetical protein QOE54_5528 [Streptosporangiaceae bacterium]|jgi:hypothetical protein|nr:hypothetical protein [Streptosporangiaceae bacterium]